ncbi:MAG TPA: hypothetical protein VFR15_09395 [Chloroflexia bacterium]|nr:hypothetical protein [Chloroflexia bacterium]
MAHSAAHNKGRTSSRAAYRPARFALALLVGIALTSICQGHDTGEHRLAPHLALLPEDAGHEAGEVQLQPHAETAPGAMYTVAGPGSTGAHDVVSLGAALPLLALLGLPARRRWPRPAGMRPHANAPMQPEPPPPRQP